MAHWIDGYDQELVARCLEEGRSLGSNGTVSFRGFGHTEYVALFTTMLKMHADIPETERLRIISKATFSAGKSEINAKRLLNEVNRLEGEYLRKDKKTYRLISSISTQLSTSPLRFRIRESSVTIGARIDSRTSKERSSLLTQARGSLVGEFPSFYSPIIVAIQARSADEAAERGLNDLDLLRGIWNLWKNRMHSIRISSGMRSPVNAIVLGPVHTLHEANGKRATDTWWYEPNWLAPIGVWRDSGHGEKMFRYARSFRKQFSRVPYRNDIAFAVIRYVRALDSRDWNYSFLQLWSVLEQLTGTTQRESYEATVKRASFLFKDSAFAKQTLLHLRDQRNKSVHHGTDSENVETLMYQLKRFVEALIEFHVARAGVFSSLAEASEFMNSPADISALIKKIRMLQRAHQYLSN